MEKREAKTAPVQTAAKSAAEVKEETAAVKETAVKAEAKDTAKKETAKKETAAKKTTKKTPAKKTESKKAENRRNLSSVPRTGNLHKRCNGKSKTGLHCRRPQGIIHQINSSVHQTGRKHGLLRN